MPNCRAPADIEGRFATMGSCDAPSQKVGATPSSRDEPGTPFGLADGSGDEASPARSATGASQLRTSPLHLSIESFRLGRLAIPIQPVAQAHDGMFPQHARTGVTHHDAGLFAAVALVTMHRAIGARRLFLAEPATLQPHFGVIQKLPAFGAQAGAAGGPPALPMMVAAINPRHRRHCFPFARQPPASQIVSTFRGDRDCDRCGNQFKSRFHVDIVARRTPARFDTSQSLA